MKSLLLIKQTTSCGQVKLSDDDIPHCDDNERWNSGTKYAVVKKNAKRAIAVFDNLKDAQNKCGAGYYVETRVGEDLKCDNYCDVKKYCNYWRKKQLWLD